jgi:hypothetical protein
MKAQRHQPAQPESAEKWEHATHEEARMVLPGIQTLFGFQLIAVFNARFTELEAGDRLVHLSALVLIALAIALIMTPAAYHRISEQGRMSVYFTKLASTLIAAAMLPLLIGLSLDIYVVTRIAMDVSDVWPAALVASGAFVVFAGLWIAFPYWHRSHPPRTRARSQAEASS